MTTTQPPKLVRLRTAPMPDPGEWCVHPTREIADDCPMHFESRCLANHVPIRVSGPFPTYRRPQSCIDAAEEEET